MQRLAPSLLAWMLSFSVPVAGAVLLGEPEDGAPSPLLRLAFERQDAADDPLAQHVAGQAYCPAAVVGGRPLTLITAAHCLREVRLEEQGNLPVVRLLSARSDRRAQAKLRWAVYAPFATVDQNLAEDLAILVFDVDADESVQVLPVGGIGTTATVRICGYGAGFRERDLNVARCADKRVLSGCQDIYRFVPRSYKESNPTLFLQFRTQFASKSAAVSRLVSLLAVNRRDRKGRYSTAEPSRYGVTPAVHGLRGTGKAGARLSR